MKNFLRFFRRHWILTAISFSALTAAAIGITTTACILFPPLIIPAVSALGAYLALSILLAVVGNILLAGYDKKDNEAFKKKYFSDPFFQKTPAQHKQVMNDFKKEHFSDPFFQETSAQRKEQNAQHKQDMDDFKKEHFSDPFFQETSAQRKEQNTQHKQNMDDFKKKHFSSPFFNQAETKQNNYLDPLSFRSR